MIGHAPIVDPGASVALDFCWSSVAVFTRGFSYSLVRRRTSMISWQRDGLTAITLCLAACSSPKSAAVAIDAAAAHRAGVGTAAPDGSFRAALLAVDPAPEALAHDVASAGHMRVRRSHVTAVADPTVGDLVLVDVASYNEAQHLIERVNVFGVLLSRAGDVWSVRDSRTHRVQTVRISAGAWLRAPHGVYRLRTTGAVVGQPAYYVQLERYASLPASGRIVAFPAAH